MARCAADRRRARPVATFRGVAGSRDRLYASDDIDERESERIGEFGR
jgi:hypothetical protein